MVITHASWRNRFNADPAILGRMIVLDAVPRAIVGVLPPGVRYPVTDSHGEIFSPLGRLELDLAGRGNRSVTVLLLLSVITFAPLLLGENFLPFRRFDDWQLGVTGKVPKPSDPQLVKRSVRISGHPTSVSLEAPFWQALRDIAALRQISVNALLSTIDAERGGNLSSAIRLFVLESCRRGELGDR